MNNNLKNICIRVISMLMVCIGFLSVESELTNILLFLISLMGLILLVLNSSRMLGISECSIKLKTVKFLNILGILFILSVFVISSLNGGGNISVTDNNKILIISIISGYMLLFGNLAPKIPMNRCIGLRLPWTVSNDIVWRKTHKFLGYVSVIISILMFISVFFINGNVVGIIGVGSWVLIPSIYSCLVLNKTNKK